MLLCHVTPAIVLRTWPFGESDKIVSFLTEKHGKLRGIAKGAKRSRKRFVNSLEPFSVVNLRFQDRAHSNLVFVLASDLAVGFKHLLTSLEKISFASYLVEITDGLIGEREENGLIFQHLRDGLTHLEKHATSLTFLTSFELNLLKLAGYQPFLDGCRLCGRERRGQSPTRWHFSFRDGGILCQSCSRLRKEIFSLSVATLELLTYLQQEQGMRSSDTSPPTQVLKEIRSVIVRFIEFHMEREIKSAALLNQFSWV
ncbi:MAG TPA: DNA repair protein RecO [Candidatus Binatia bacterium]|nr:DNA repair protein RecO [Candidatus Binatia bacterium]